MYSPVLEKLDNLIIFIFFFFWFYLLLFPYPTYASANSHFSMWNLPKRNFNLCSLFSLSKNILCNKEGVPEIWRFQKTSITSVWMRFPTSLLVNYDQHFLFPHSHFLHSHLPPQVKLGGQSCVIAFLKLIVKGNIKKKFKGKKYIMVIDMPQIHWTQFLPFPGVATFDM